jgi:hypothetical protein
MITIYEEATSSSRQALLRAEHFPDEWPGVYSATMGVVFLGTPFRGAPGLTQSEMIRAVDASYKDTIQKEILRIHDPDDELLLEMVHDFEKILGRSSIRPRLTCFFEQKPCNVKAIVGKEEKKARIFYAYNNTKADWNSRSL